VSFTPPPMPYTRLQELHDIAAAQPGGKVDCTIGTPCDPPAEVAMAALARGEGARGYPPSIGTPEFRGAARDWMARRFKVEVDAEHVAACVGTKEFVTSAAGYLALRDGTRDTVLYPAISYPSYAMGAQLAGLRSHAVWLRDGVLDLASVPDELAARAVVLWCNSPGNPTGAIEDLAAAAAWGRAHGVPVLSDECYVEYTWDGPATTILESGSTGVLAVHSISKRSNLAGLRAGFYAGDPDLVAYFKLVRQHAGDLVPGPVQAAAAAAFADDEHVAVQRERYRGRLIALSSALSEIGVDAPMPRGSFYLWASRPGTDGWALARELAERGGVVVSPGELYGAAGAGHVRIAVVVPDEQVDLVVSRLTSR